MLRTLNQVMRELSEIASAHRQINEFFQGDFLDAISRDAAQYPLMVVTLAPGNVNETSVQMSATITICDKYNHSEYRQINEVHSDCLSIVNDLNTTFRQYRWTEFVDITDDITIEPFINEGQDMVAGWTMSVNFDVYNELNWCDIPYDGYDFENGPAAPEACGDPFTTYQIYVNGNLIDTFTLSTTENNTINIEY
jgi:hypothetical protein